MPDLSNSVNYLIIRPIFDSVFVGRPGAVVALNIIARCADIPLQLWREGIMGISRALLLLWLSAWSITSPMTAYGQATPQPSEIYPTVQMTGESAKVDLKAVTQALGSSDKIKVTILNNHYESYVDAAAIFNDLCHVATLSTSQVIVSTCAADVPRQLVRWSNFLAGLASEDAMNIEGYISKWGPELEGAGAKHYLVDKGETLVPVTIRGLVGMSLSDQALGAPLSTSLAPACSLSKETEGRRVLDTCKGSIPLPPVWAEFTTGTLTIARQSNEEAFVNIDLRVVPASAPKGTNVATLPRLVVPVKVAKVVSKTTQPTPASVSTPLAKGSSLPTPKVAAAATSSQTAVSVKAAIPTRTATPTPCKKESVQAYKDIDGDRRASELRVFTICANEALPKGYYPVTETEPANITNRPVQPSVGGTSKPKFTLKPDCDDNDPRIYVSKSFNWLDGDGDLHGIKISPKTFCTVDDTWSASYVPGLPKGSLGIQYRSVNWSDKSVIAEKDCDDSLGDPAKGNYGGRNIYLLKKINSEEVVNPMIDKSSSLRGHYYKRTTDRMVCTNPESREFALLDWTALKDLLIPPNLAGQLKLVDFDRATASIPTSSPTPTSTPAIPESVCKDERFSNAAKAGPCASKKGVGNCLDGADNDRDGLVDCYDTDCAGEGVCTIDNCGDGLCIDGETKASCPEDCETPVKTEECANRVDDDGDGLIDCLDTDCAPSVLCPRCGDSICQANRGESSLTCSQDCGLICGNNADDDGDGLIDDGVAQDPANPECGSQCKQKMEKADKAVADAQQRMDAAVAKVDPFRSQLTDRLMRISGSCPAVRQSPPIGPDVTREAMGWKAKANAQANLEVAVREFNFYKAARDALAASCGEAAVAANFPWQDTVTRGRQALASVLDLSITEAHGAGLGEDCASPDDHDGDGLRGCDDPDCRGDEFCADCDPGTGACPPEECVGGNDEDKDWLIDCGDPDCMAETVCTIDTCTPEKIQDARRIKAALDNLKEFDERWWDFYLTFLADTYTKIENEIPIQAELAAKEIYFAPSAADTTRILDAHAAAIFPPRAHANLMKADIIADTRLNISAEYQSCLSVDCPIDEP